MEILWFTIDIPLDVTFGDPNPEALPPAHPLEDLKKELNDARNIRYELPAWAGESMVYAKGADKFLDPLGDIVFSQSVVPLNLELGMYGGGPPPADERKLDVGLCDAANYSIRTGAPPTSKFSPAQFIRVSDAEKLAAPAFEDFQSGIRFGPAYEFDPSAKDRKLEFEDILFESETYIRAHGTPQYQSALCRPLKFGAAFPGESNALRNAPLTGSQKYFTPARGIKRKGFVSVQNPAYAVSNGDSLGGKMCSDMAAGTTYTQAMAAHKRDGAEDGEVMDAGGLALKGG